MGVRSIRRNMRRFGMEQWRRYGRVPDVLVHRPPHLGTRKRKLRELRASAERARVLRSRFAFGSR